MVAGCGGAPKPDRPPATLEELVEWVREIRLEENDEVINVEPRVRPDPHGGYLVADAREAQLRRYDRNGALVRAFGRKGDGPGEFRSPSAALRLSDGAILGVDRGGRYTLFDSAAGAIVRTGRVPVSPVWEVEVLDDSTLLIAGGSSMQGPRLHRWKLFSDAVSNSFFTPPSRRVGGLASAAVGPAGIVATFGLADTVYVFGTDGTERIKIPIRSGNFRRYADSPGWPPPPEWRSSFSVVEDANWLPDGSILVQFAYLRDGGPEWHLLNVTAEGETRFALANVPRLLATSGGGNRFLFVAPGADAPNIWRGAKLRQE